MNTSIQIPASVKAAIQQQPADSPQLFLPEDREEFLASVGPEHQVEAEIHFNRFAALDEQRRWDFLANAVCSIDRMLQQDDSGRFQKPLLTLDEAASMLSLSPKRFKNIICEERVRLGRSPDFLCDANGRICCRVLRDELLDWVKGRNRKSVKTGLNRR